MSYQVKTTRQAEVEAEAIYLWIAQYSPERATLCYFDLQAAIESLANFPARCAGKPDLRPRDSAVVVW